MNAETWPSLALLFLWCWSSVVSGFSHHGAVHAALHEVDANHLDKRLLLNPLSDPIEVTGDHEFQTPGKSDQRGPCPGLNALANHGYIPRNGIVSLTEASMAINTVWGMGIELATILAVMGVVWTGNPLSLNPSFSIGGNDTRVANLLGNALGLLGNPQGIDLSHNLIEADSSPTRDDLFVTGDASTMNLTKFEGMFNMVPVDGNETFTSDVIAAYAAKRFQESIETNPSFYFGPFTGSIARNAGFLFISRLFANHSAETPEGVLTHGILKDIFAVSGDPGNFTYQRGWERIPNNWYKTPVDYGLVQLNLDLVDWISQYPELGSIGGNVDGVNTFAGVNLGDPESGLVNVPKLLESNNLFCFALEIVKLAAPSYTNNLISTLAKPLNLLLDTLAVPLLNLSCPSWDAMTVGGVPLYTELQQRFPGANITAL